MTKSCGNSRADIILAPAALPWTGAAVRVASTLRPYFEARLGPDARYLRDSISLFADPEIEDTSIFDFVESTADFFLRELDNRQQRQKRFVELGLFEDELEMFLTHRTQAQPWAIYYSRGGGLGVPDNARGLQADAGVIPCSTMRNHGVAWKRNDGTLHLWLATARKPGGDWDFGSDIGHESAHAAFAHIPLFSQALFEADRLVPLRRVESIENTSRAHMALLVYYFMEIAVCAVRGESRNTPTGLPVPDFADLSALLRLSAEIFPQDGFPAALCVLARAQGALDVESGREIYEIAAPIMRVIPRLAPLIRDAQAPDLVQKGRPSAGAQP